MTKNDLTIDTTDVYEKLMNLSSDDRDDAVDLLLSLGISPEKKREQKESKKESLLKSMLRNSEHNHIIFCSCSTCKSTIEYWYHMTFDENYWALRSIPIMERPSKFTKSKTTTDFCCKCMEVLGNLPKEELIIRILEIVVSHRKITDSPLPEPIKEKEKDPKRK